MVKDKMSESKAGIGRILAKAASLGALAALVGLGVSTWPAAGGAGGGAVIAGMYCFGYIRSHTQRTSIDKFFDGSVAIGSGFRLMLVLGGGVVAYLAGRDVVVAYLASFAVVFAILVVSEIPAARRSLRARSAQ